MEPKTQLVLEEELISWSGHRWFRIGVLLIMILDVVAWAYILSGKKIEHSELYFLNVGQGDSSLALLPGGVKVLIDGGPMNGVLQKNLETILPIQDRYVDVVKISHHGSKYSSGPVFFKEARPLVSIVEVGKNSYGHPTQQTLNRLADIGTQIYRTDQDSILKVVLADQQIQIFKTQY